MIVLEHLEIVSVKIRPEYLLLVFGLVFDVAEKIASFFLAVLIEMPRLHIVRMQNVAVGAAVALQAALIEVAVVQVDALAVAVAVDFQAVVHHKPVVVRVEVLLVLILMVLYNLMEIENFASC